MGGGYPPPKTAGTTTSRIGGLNFYSGTGYILSSWYQYDNNGNVTVYTPQVEYEYGSDPDVNALTKMGQSFYFYDTANQLIREDNSEADGTWTYTWLHGRELASMTVGNDTLYFTYGVFGHANIIFLACPCRFF